MQLSMTSRGSSAIVVLPLVALQVIASATSSLAEMDFPVYEKRCGQCHGSNVKELARNTLLKRGGVIVTRDRTVELRKFLNRHGRSTTIEADRIYSLLRRHVVSERK